MALKSLVRLTCIIATIFLITVDLGGFVAAVTKSRTKSKSRSRSFSVSTSPTPKPSVSSSIPASKSPTAHISFSSSISVSPSATSSVTPSKSASSSRTASASKSASASRSATRSVTASRTASRTASMTPSISISSAPFCLDNSVTIFVDGIQLTQVSNLNVYLFATDPSAYPTAEGGIGIENRTLSTQSTTVEIPVLGTATFPSTTEINPVTIFSGTMSANYPQIWPNWTGFKGGCIGDTTTTASCALDSAGIISCSVTFNGKIDGTTLCSHTLTFQACWRKVHAIPSYPQDTLYVFPYSL